MEKSEHLTFKRVLLIYPPTGMYMRDDRCQAPVEGMTAQPMRTPLDLGYMAAVLEGVGVTCKIKDYPSAGQGWAQFEADLRDFNPDMLVLSITTPTMAADMVASQIAKRWNKDTVVVSKGAHFLVNDEEVLVRYKELDVIIRGESEFTVADLATAASFSHVPGITYRRGTQIQKTADRPRLDELDILPFPARHLMDNSLYLTPDTREQITLIYAGRGCPHQCIYCAVPPVSGANIKLRSPENIVAEIQECVEKYDIRNFFFRADTFTWDEAWLITICQLIVEKDLPIRWGTNSRVDTISASRLEWMKKAGCWIIGFGVESGSQKSLDMMKKRTRLEQAREAVLLCHRYGIKAYTLFIIGFPWEDAAAVKESTRFAREIDGDYLDINIAYPLPGTALYELAKKEGLFDEENMHGFDYAKPLIRTKYLTTHELIALRRKGLLAFYLRPRYIWRTLLSIRSWTVFTSYVRSGWQLIAKLFFKKGNVADAIGEVS